MWRQGGLHPVSISGLFESGYSRDMALSSELRLFAFNHGAQSCLIRFKSCFATFRDISIGMKIRRFSVTCFLCWAHGVISKQVAVNALWEKGSDLQGQGNVRNLFALIWITLHEGVYNFSSCVCMCFFMHMYMPRCTCVTECVEGRSQHSLLPPITLHLFMVSLWAEELDDCARLASWRALRDSLISVSWRCDYRHAPLSLAFLCGCWGSQLSKAQAISPARGEEAGETSAGSLGVIWEVCPHWLAISVLHCCPPLACRNQSVPTASGLVRVTFRSWGSEPALLSLWSWSSLDGDSVPHPVPHRLGCKMTPLSGLQSDVGGWRFWREKTLSLLLVPQAPLQSFVPCVLWVTCF